MRLEYILSVSEDKVGVALSAAGIPHTRTTVNGWTPEHGHETSTQVIIILKYEEVAEKVPVIDRVIVKLLKDNNQKSAMLSTTATAGELHVEAPKDMPELPGFEGRGYAEAYMYPPCPDCGRRHMPVTRAKELLSGLLGGAMKAPGAPVKSPVEDRLMNLLMSAGKAERRGDN